MFAVGPLINAHHSATIHSREQHDTIGWSAVSEGVQRLLSGDDKRICAAGESIEFDDSGADYITTRCEVYDQARLKIGRASWRERV
jgi:hypothetical protein